MRACRADLGTGDEVGLDVLINTIRGFSRECLGVKQLCIGGSNADWPTPDGEQEEQVRRMRRPCALCLALLPGPLRIHIDVCAAARHASGPDGRR